MTATRDNSLLTPDQLRKLADEQVTHATRISNGPARLRILTYADALNNLADIKKLLMDYERRLLN
jgi:hypothetical protein